MNKIRVIAESVKHFAEAHPYLTGSAALFSIFILLLRKIHYKFIVYPSTIYIIRCGRKEQQYQYKRVSSP